MSTAKLDRGPRDRDSKFWTATDRDHDRDPHYRDLDRDRVTTSAKMSVLAVCECEGYSTFSKSVISQLTSVLRLKNICCTCVWKVAKR